MMRNKYKNTKSKKLCIVALCAPAILHLILFWAGCQVETMRLAFTDATTGLFSLENFEWAISELFGGAAVGDMRIAFKNTMIFFIVGLIRVPFSIFFAYLIFRKCFGATFTRLGLYLPGAISGIMMAILYSKMMASDGPLVPWIQKIFGAEGTYMFMVEHPLAYIIIFDIFVGMGGSLVIWLGSMGRIPQDLIEYGKLEGITPVREFLTVILPLIWPTFVTMITLQIIGLFGSSGSVMILTNGQYGTSTLSFWMYRVVRDSLSSEYGRVAAAGLIFTILTIPILILGRKFMDRFGEEVEY